MESSDSDKMKFTFNDSSSSDEEEFELRSQPSTESEDNPPPSDPIQETGNPDPVESGNVKCETDPSLNQSEGAIESEMQIEIPKISQKDECEEKDVSKDVLVQGEEDVSNVPAETDSSEIFQSAVATCESDEKESDIQEQESNVKESEVQKSDVLDTDVPQETRPEPEVLAVAEHSGFPPIATSHEETWDYSLLPKTEASDINGKSGTIWLADTEFQRKLEVFNAFDTCDHEAIKIQCPCDNKVAFSICSKCHRVFCNNKCLKTTKDKKLRTNTDAHEILPKPRSSSNSTGVASSSGPSHSLHQSASSSSGSVYSGPHPVASMHPSTRINSGRQHNQMQRKGEYRHVPNPGAMTSPQLLVNVPQLPRPNVLHQAVRMGQSQDMFGAEGLMGQWPSGGQVQGPPLPQHQQPQIYHQIARPMRHRQPFVPQSFPSFRPNIPQNDRVPIYRNPDYPTTVPPQPSYTNNNIPTLHASGLPRGSTPSSFTSGPWPNFNEAGQDVFPLLNGNNTNSTNARNVSELIGNRSKVETVASPCQTTGPRASSSPSAQETPIADVNELKKFRGVGRGGQANICSSPSTNYAAGVGNSSDQISTKRAPQPVPSGPSVTPKFVNRSLNPYAPVVAKNPIVTADYSPMDAARTNSKPIKIFPDYSPQSSSKSPPGGNNNKWNKYPIGQLRKTSPSKSGINPNHSIISTTAREPGRVTKAPFPLTSSPSPNKMKAGSGLQTTPQNVSNEFRCEPYIFFGVPMQVSHTHGDSLFDFYVSSGIGAFANDSIWQELMTTDPSKNDIMMNPVVGDYCIAKYNCEDDGINAWYRARITRIEGNLFTVFFFDHGNSSVVTKNFIRELPANLKQMRPSVIRIAIGDFEPTVPIEELRPVFENFIRLHKFRVRIIIFRNPMDSTENSYPCLYKAKVEIKHDGQWVGLAAILENDGFGHTISFATQVNKLIETKCDEYPCFEFNDIQQEIGVKISHYIHPNDFYVIPENRIKEREDIMGKLNVINVKYRDYSMKEWENTNYVCIAQRSDRKWARAIITEITEDSTVMIRFFDFGETVGIPLIELKLKMIPRELLSVPQLAYRCSLPIFPPAEGKWDLANPYVTVFQDLKNMDIPIVIIAFARDFDINEIPVHIVEVFQQDSVRGLSKSFLKKMKDSCVLEYTVDLDIRKKIQKPTSKRAERESPLPQKTIGTCDLRPQVEEAPLRPSNMGQRDDASFTRVPEIKFFQLRDLEPSKPLQFFSKSEFKITSFNGFNELFIQPSNFLEIEMRLQDVIIECVDTGKSFSEIEIPPLNSIVIVPDNDGNFHRAVIKKISNRKARVEFIDNGKSSRIPFQQLTPASDGVRKFPKLVYRVKLVNVEDDPDLLLQDDCIEVMEKLFKMTLLMESCTGSQEPYVVNLRPLGAPIADTVSKRMLNKQVWEWETVFDSGCRTDTALLSKSKFRHMCPPKVSLIHPRILPPGVKFNGEVSRFISDGDLCIVDIQDSLVRRDHQVLEKQIARFVEKVASTALFPAIEEVILMYLPDIPEIREFNLHGTGKWNRCIRETADCFRNIDYDELYPIRASENFRRLSPEFLLRVPIGMVECRLKDYKPSASLNERMHQELGNRKRVRFTVDHYDQENEIHVITIDNLPV